MDNEIGGEDERRSLSRRAVIAGGAVAAAGVVGGGVILSVRDRGATAAPAEPAATTAPISPTVPATTVPAAPFRPTDIVLPIGEFDAVDGISPFTTPIEDHFLLGPSGEPGPVIDADTYSLRIGGPFARNPITLSYDDLLAREQVTRQVCLVSAWNTVGEDWLSNVVWTGVPLSVLLDEAGIEDPADPDIQVFSTGADGLTGGFRAPLAYDGRTAMVALFMNGEPLPAVHGFPARLVVAGEYLFEAGTKWLESIELTEFFGVDGFWIPRGWAKEAPVKTSSRIATHTSGAEFAAGPQTIGGVAWAPLQGIGRVEVSIEDANEVRARQSFDPTSWLEAEIGSVESDETWVQWRYDWEATPGEWVIRVRATDKSGFTQRAEVVAPVPDGSEGFHTIVVRIEPS